MRIINKYVIPAVEFLAIGYCALLALGAVITLLIALWRLINAE
jgi:hypothetical protein